jgi:hypothetical protein
MSDVINVSHHRAPIINVKQKRTEQILPDVTCSTTKDVRNGTGVSLQIDRNE